jgi:hypothetical protein
MTEQIAVTVTVRIMTKHEAEAIDARIMAYSNDWFRTVAPLLMEMKERQGYAALGYESFQDYCKSVDRRLGHHEVVTRLLTAKVRSSFACPRSPRGPRSRWRCAVTRLVSLA